MFCNLKATVIELADVLKDAGVSAANRQRVMEAAKQLGYLPMIDAVTLPSRPANLEFFLPIARNAFMVARPLVW